MTIIAFRPRTIATADETTLDATAPALRAPEGARTQPAEHVEGVAEVAEVDHPETVKLLRRTLRAAFPGTKFSVTRSTGSSYGWISVRWTDGPRARDVDTVARQFEGCSFDGMTDSYRQNPPALMTLPGNATPGLYRFTCCGITASRSMGAAGYAAVAEHINAIQPQAVHADGTTLRGAITEDTRDLLDVVHAGDDLQGIAWEVFCRLTIPA